MVDQVGWTCSCCGVRTLVRDMATRKYDGRAVPVSQDGTFDCMLLVLDVCLLLMHRKIYWASASMNLS
jgi:hypothetical protein